MYICKSCNQEFTRPMEVRGDFTDRDGHRCHESAWVCPVCAGADIALARPCPVCGAWRPAGEPLCRACRRRLKEGFVGFVEGLCPEEAEVLDDWLDGVSVLSCRTFR